MRLLLIITIPILSVIGCKNNKKAAEANYKPPIPEVIINSDFQPSKEMPRFKVSSWTIEGDILKIDVNYSGGCEEHTFKAHFNGLWMKSLPMKGSVNLEHIVAKPDPCREQVTKSLEFNVSKMRVEQYDKLIIQSPNGKHQAVYEY
jgi:hypothetical protein